MKCILHTLRIMLVILIIGSTFQPASMHAWLSRVVPLSFDQNTQTWNALLMLDGTSLQWTDFHAPCTGRGAGRTQAVASQALATQTKNKYTNVSLQNMPWHRDATTGDVYHFVPVSFVHGSDLFKQKPASVIDFRWTTVDELISLDKNQQLKSKTKYAFVDENFLRVIQTQWNNIVKNLPAPTQQPPQTTSPQETPVQTATTTATLPLPTSVFQFGAYTCSFPDIYKCIELSRGVNMVVLEIRWCAPIAGLMADELRRTIEYLKTQTSPSSAAETAVQAIKNCNAICHDAAEKLTRAYRQKLGVQTVTPASTERFGFNWLHIKPASEVILFYNSNEPYFEFTNFYLAPVLIDNQQWPSSEHYYQAMKFTELGKQAQIRDKETAREAFKTAQLMKNFIRSDWQQVNIDFMYKALQEKFTQNAELRDRLLDTGTKILVENAGENDDFYGAGPDGRGQNHLGRLLMLVRESIRRSGGSTVRASSQVQWLVYDPRTTFAFENLQRNKFDLSKALPSQS